MASYISKPMGPAGNKTKHFAMLCLGGYVFLSGTRAMLEEYVPRPARRHPIHLETGATAYVTLPDEYGSLPCRPPSRCPPAGRLARSTSSFWGVFLLLWLRSARPAACSDKLSDGGQVEAALQGHPAA